MRIFYSGFKVVNGSSNSTNELLWTHITNTLDGTHCSLSKYQLKSICFITTPITNSVTTHSTTNTT